MTVRDSISFDQLMLTGATGDDGADKELWDKLVSFYDEEKEMTKLMLQRITWTQIQLAGEVKMSDINASVTQLLNYMRAQRRVQSWMRFVLGLVATKTQCGLVRADPVGVEQCIIPYTSSHGVLEVVRIALGIRLSDGINLGRHPAFELRYVPHELPANVPIATEQLGEVTREVQPSTMQSREAHFIHLSPQTGAADQGSPSAPALPAPKTSYYVHHLMEDRGSLVGRSTRVFVVSRETHNDSTAHERQFFGPFVLKLHYASWESTCFRDHIVEKTAASKELLQHVLVPSRYVH
jgi:hypothetical protein